jgi:putative tryptophan/tyrosine transport system substrate-binding protein
MSQLVPPPTAPHALRRRVLAGAALGAAASGPGDRVKRRAFLLLAAAALPWPSRVFAQRTLRVGVLLPMAGLAGERYVSAIRERLAQHGLIDGRNLRLEFQYAGGPTADVRELVRSKPDAFIVATTILTRSLQQAADSAPIVFAWVADPVFSGIVRSYSRPEGNATGVANRFFELANKRIELLRELLPAARRVALAAGVFDTTLEEAMGQAQEAARRLDLELFRVEAGGAWRGALERAVGDRADAVLVLTPFSIFGMRWAAEEVVHFSIERRVPVIYSDLESVELGGLISYGNDLIGDLQQAADLLGRVLKGEKPTDIPVEQAARFELAVNLKTARAIGLEVPSSILLRADKVIE